jgi:hypothetical protein
MEWRGMRRSVVIILGVAVLAVALEAVLLFRFLGPHRKFAMLLCGSDTVTVKEFEIAGQGRRVLCKNPELSRLLEECVRNAEQVAEFSVWRSYVLTVSMRPNGECKSTIYLGEEGNSFVIAFWSSALAEMASISDPRHYEVTFPEVESDTLRQLFEALRGEKRGTITIAP